MECELSDHGADRGVSQWLNCQEPRTTPEEALVHPDRIDLKNLKNFHASAKNK